MVNRQRDVESTRYAEEAFLFFSALNYSTSNESLGMDFQEVVVAKNQFYENMEMLIGQKLLTLNDHEWKRNTRSLNALADGIKKGYIVLSDADDIDLLSGAIDFFIFEFPQVIEYYAYTGEFMDLLRLLDENSSEHGIVKKRAMMHKIYTYDVTKVREHLLDAEAPELYMRIPLEVRAQFAEFDTDLPSPSDLEDMIDHQYIMLKMDCEMFPLPPLRVFD